MKPEAKRRVIRLIFRLIVGGVFIFASLHKISSPPAFARIIYGYKIFPGFLINLSAIVLPWVELFAGLFLVLGIFQRGACLIINSLLLIFALAISFNVARGLEFDCGCFSFSSGEGGSPGEIIIRDILMLAAGLWLFFSKK